MWEAKRGDKSFWNQVDKKAPNGCWEWIGSKTAAGYGRICNEYAHRRSAKMAGMTLGSDQFVCHKCDNPCCVNPQHLFVGNAKINTADMLSKGRNQHGETHCCAKLTATQVLAIRSAKGIQRVIAEQYGITQSHVSMIKSGAHWKHLK